MEARTGLAAILGIGGDVGSLAFMRERRAVLAWVAACLVAMAAGIGVGVGQSSSSSSSSSGQNVPLVLPPAPGVAPMEDEDRLSPQEGAKRNALVQPGLDLLKQGNSKAAFASLSSVLTTYPNDLFVLRYTAAAAMGAGQNEQAIALFRRALALYPRNPWPLRNAVIILEARLNQWADFDRDVAALRSAKKNGMDHGLDNSPGFVIEEFEGGTGMVQGEIYPLQSGRYHTLYRFVLPAGEVTAPARSGSSSSAVAARCVNPDFQPHLDAESDDADQPEFRKAHPDRAAKGERSYALILYGAPCTQDLVGFYPDGEPTYERVRADVVRVLTGPGKHS
jgi:tetratricopeptide (TPR) repeat protein